MTDYMLVLLTAHGCGHCEFFRGSGIIENGKHFMSRTYLENILNKNVKFYNIHYSSMNGFNTDIISVSKIEKINNNIEQNIFYKNKKQTVSHSKKILDKSVKNVIDKEDNMKWSDFIKQKIPINLQGYVFYFPCFGMFKIKNWNDCIKNNEQLIGILNLGYTVIDNRGHVYLYKDNKYLDKRKLTTDELIDKVVSGEIKIEPVKLRDLLNNTFDDNKKVNNEETKIDIQSKSHDIKPIEKPKMIIMQY